MGNSESLRLGVSGLKPEGPEPGRGSESRFGIEVRPGIRMCVSQIVIPARVHAGLLSPSRGKFFSAVICSEIRAGACCVQGGAACIVSRHVSGERQLFSVRPPLRHR